MQFFNCIYIQKIIAMFLKNNFLGKFGKFHIEIRDGEEIMSPDLINREHVNKNFGHFCPLHFTKLQQPPHLSALFIHPHTMKNQYPPTLPNS